MSGVGVQACRVLSGPKPEANEMEAGSFTGSGQGGQHKVSSTGCWDSWLQCGTDINGKAGKTKCWVERGNKLNWNFT